MTRPSLRCAVATALFLAAPVAGACDLCSVYTASMAHGETGGAYAGIATQFTRYDELATPYDTARLGDGAANILVQGQCPLRFVGHLGLVLDGAVYDGIRDALRGGPVRLACWAV